MQTIRIIQFLFFLFLFLIKHHSHSVFFNYISFLSKKSRDELKTYCLPRDRLTFPIEMDKHKNDYLFNTNQVSINFS